MHVRVQPYMCLHHQGSSLQSLLLLVLTAVPGLKLSEEEIAALTHRIQFGGDEVVKAKDGAGSATLSMAIAGANFTKQVASALSGVTGIVECTFVENEKAPTKFFSTAVELGVRLVADIMTLPNVHNSCDERVDSCIL